MPIPAFRRHLDRLFFFSIAWEQINIHDYLWVKLRSLWEGVSKFHYLPRCHCARPARAGSKVRADRSTRFCHLLKRAVLVVRLLSLFTQVLCLEYCIFSCPQKVHTPPYLSGGFWGTLHPAQSRGQRPGGTRYAPACDACSCHTDSPRWRERRRSRRNFQGDIFGQIGIVTLQFDGCHM